jgi:ABC-2 type transport system ATP-binding protein
MIRSGANTAVTIMVAAHDLTKHFATLVAVDGLNLNVSRGEVLGFLGPNGSGKSTTMRMLTGFLSPTSGTAEICGIDVVESPVAARRRIGYLPEGAPAYADMTPRAYLNFVASAHGLAAESRGEAIDRVAGMTRIEAILDQSIDTLSKGYKRRVGLAHALVHDPDVLILDEPTDGLDPNQKFEVRALIEQMASTKAIILSTHILEEVHAVCTRAMIISKGRIIADGTPQELETHSPLHNAVSVTLPAQDAAAGQGLLAAVDGVAGVEQQAAGDERVKLTALANSGREILPAIASNLRNSGLAVEQVHLETNHLDNVFRALTSGAGGNVERSPAKLPNSPHGYTYDVKGGPRTSGVLHDILAVFRREAGGYFATPLAYVFIVIFLAAAGTLTFFAGHFFAQGQASLDAFFQFHPWLYLFLIPAIGMRLWAEERKTGSIELLLTLPLTTAGAVLGKFFAAWAVAGIALALTVPIWATVNYLGSPDNGVIAAGYAGSLLMAGAYLAIGACASALTKNQVIAFILAAAGCFVFTASGLGVVLEFFSGWAPEPLLAGVANFSFLGHYRGMTRGVIGLGDAAFFTSTIAFFLFATVVCVERNKHG